MLESIQGTMSPDADSRWNATSKKIILRHYKYDNYVGLGLP
jgi:hypothetical protein